MEESEEIFMKDTKKTVAIVVAVIAAVLLVVLGIVALGEAEQAPVESGNETTQELARGDCEIVACMKELKPEMTVAEVNEIMGFEGEKSVEAEKYTWKLTSKTKIVVEYKDGLGTITATYDKDELKDSEFKISKGYELQNLLRDGTSYTYEETVEQFGGVNGYLEVNAPTSKMYLWVSEDGTAYRATFSDSVDGRTSIISIR